MKEIKEGDEILSVESGGKSATRWKLLLDKQNQIYEILKDTSDLHMLAKKLTRCVLDNEPVSLRVDAFKVYHVALVEEIINIGNKKFQDNFISSQGLSEPELKVSEKLF